MYIASDELQKINYKKDCSESAGFRVPRGGLMGSLRRTQSFCGDFSAL